MKPLKAYDVVIEDSLEEVIEVTNVAIRYGYVPLGGIKQIENKFLQTIHLKQKQKMKGFFTQLMEIMVEGQEITLKTTKEGELLIVLVDGKTSKGKALFQAKGTPEEIESEFVPAFNEAHKHSGFTSKLIEATTADVEDDDDDDDEGKKTAAETPKAEVPKKSEKVSKKAEKKTEPKEDKKPAAETETAKATDTVDDSTAEAANKQRVFNDCMEKGLNFMKEKQYQLAANTFRDSLNIFPDDSKANQQLQLAEKWVNAIASL